jgi:phosphate transport system substrate-binding protein
MTKRLIIIAALMAFMGASLNLARSMQEDLAIIVNKSNPVDELSLADLRKIFLAERSRWPNGRKVTVVMREQGRQERAAVLKLIYRMREQDFNRHFLNIRFTGENLEEPKLLASADGMIKFVFNVPGAIGYARASEVDSTVKVLRIDGLAPGQPGYKLKL